MNDHAEPGATVDKLRQVARVMEDTFVGKSEIVRLMLVSAVAREHMLLVGPPGTAKSALVRLFSRLVQAKHFEYLLTRFTEPNEIFGPIDIQAFRDGHYRRRMEGMLPEAEIVFLDEVFKANSAILNSLLTVLNERVVAIGGQVHRTPLISAYAATNDVPTDDDLRAVFDRFLVRVTSNDLDSYRFHELLEHGVEHEVRAMGGGYERIAPVLTAADLHALHVALPRYMRFDDELASAYKGLVFQIRSEGISVSDRRAVKLLKLVAASAMIDGRTSAGVGDLSVLRYVWNSPEQIEILESIVGPVLDAYYRDHPEARRHGAAGVGVDALVTEINRIRDVLTSSEPISDIQLFSQMKALGQIKAALSAIGTTPAREAIGRIDQLLGHVFESGKLAK